MSLLPIHKTGEATKNNKAEKERGKSGRQRTLQKYMKDTVAVQKEKRKEKQPRDTTYVLKEFHHEDFSMGILVYVSMCICKRRISNHKTQAADELRQMIKDFEQTNRARGDAAEEGDGLCPRFCKEYLTYEKGRPNRISEHG